MTVCMDIWSTSKLAELSTILYLCFLLSFSSDWEDISNTRDRDCVWPQYQKHQSWSKILRVVFSTCFSVFRNVLEQGFSIVYDITSRPVVITYFFLGFKASVDCYINRCSGVLGKRTKSFDILYSSSVGYLLNLWWFCFLTVFVFVLRVSCLFHPIQKLLVSHVIFFSSACLRLVHRAAKDSLCLVFPWNNNTIWWCVTCNFVMRDAWYEKHEASTNLLVISTLLSLDPLRV